MAPPATFTLNKSFEAFTWIISLNEEIRLCQSTFLYKVFYKIFFSYFERFFSDLIHLSLFIIIQRQINA